MVVEVNDVQIRSRSIRDDVLDCAIQVQASLQGYFLCGLDTLTSDGIEHNRIGFFSRDLSNLSCVVVCHWRWHLDTDDDRV